MKMKMNYLKLNPQAAAALVGMRSLAICSDDNNGEGDENDEGEEAVANNRTLKGSADGLKTVILTKGYNFPPNGEYIIKAGSTLKIGEDVTISAKSDGATIDYILVEQGAKIETVDTASVPIIMVSDTEEPEAQGGIHICGKAPINIGSTGKSEVGDATYDGPGPANNSGILKYTRLEYTGYRSIIEKEYSDFTFYGVGNGTTLEYLKAYRGTDDSFEWFGGTVNAKYPVSISNSDDSFDWIEGWSGENQFLAAYQGDPVTLGYTCDCLIEAGNYDKNMDATPISCPTLASLTLIGANSDEGRRGIHLRVGIQAKIYNTLITGKANNLTTETGQIEKYPVNGPSVSSYITTTGDIKANDGGGYSSTPSTAAENHGVINQTFSFSSTFIGVQEGGADFSVDSFFEKAVYRGAVKADSEWTKSWTKL